MLKYYSVTILFSIVIMGIMKVMVCGNELLDRKVKIRLDATASLVILASIGEWSGVMMDSIPVGFRALHIAGKVIELSLAPVIPILLADIIGHLRFRIQMAVFLVIHAMLVLFSVFTGLIFYVDASDVYHHGPLYFLYVAAFSFGIFCFLWEVVRQSMKQYGNRKRLLLSLPAFMLMALVIQYATDEIRIIWLCCSISVMLVYIMYMELTMNTDALTHLMNRRYYESRIMHLREACAILYFDVDDFKHVNDTYGHPYGDFVLAEVGRVLEQTYGKKGFCYRIGGDEFSVIAHLSREKMEESLISFQETMAGLREKDARMPGVSVGCAFFDPKQEKGNETIARADAMMYQNKRKKKLGRSENPGSKA